MKTWSTERGAALMRPGRNKNERSTYLSQRECTPGIDDKANGREHFARATRRTHCSPDDNPDDIYKRYGSPFIGRVFPLAENAGETYPRPFVCPSSRSLTVNELRSRGQAPTTVKRGTEAGGSQPRGVFIIRAPGIRARKLYPRLGRTDEYESGDARLFNYRPVSYRCKRFSAPPPIDLQR